METVNKNEENEIDAITIEQETNSLLKKNGDMYIIPVKNQN
jgi:hypothetical protein